MDVTDVLRDRMQEPPGLQRMATISVLVHAAAIAAVIVAPGALLPSQDRAPKSVMTITLGSGAPGPQSGGFTPMGGRAVQAELPPDVKRVPMTPPAAKTPEMTVPLPGKTQVKASPTPAVKQAPDTARGRTPSRGAETLAGSTTAETNVRGQGFGLSTSGGVGTGIKLDVYFCCPDYLKMMSQRIHQHWDSHAETPSQVEVTFTIQRNGTLSTPILRTPSGNPFLDLQAQRAIVTTRQLPPLPVEFPNPTLTVHLTFQYVR